MSVSLIMDGRPSKSASTNKIATISLLFFVIVMLIPSTVYVVFSLEIVETWAEFEGDIGEALRVQGISLLWVPAINVCDPSYLCAARTRAERLCSIFAAILS